MPRRPSLSQMINAMPSWIYLLAGLTLLTAALLVPAWVDVQDLAWQRDVMTAQHEALQEQLETYESFSEALERRDPVLLTRLARAQLNRGRAGQTPIPVGSEVREAELCVDPLKQATPIDSPDAWLAQPLPRVGSELNEPPIYRSRLVRLTTGQHRPGILAAAGIFLFVGLWRGQPTPDDTPTDLGERLRRVADREA